MTRRLAQSFLFLVLSLTTAAFAANPATMRLDYYHTGNATQEFWSFDRVVIEPLPWPGDMSKTVDNTNLGNYFFEVHDAASGKLLYSRGFGALFSEWAETDEAKTLNRTFSESLRFPRPDAPVKIVLKERREGKDVDFHEVWTTTIDPKDKFIDTMNPKSPGPLHHDPEERRAGDEGRPAHPRRWLRRRRARQVRGRRQARHRDTLLALALQRASQGLQRMGAVPAGGAARHLPALDGCLSASAARHLLRHVRQRALHHDHRQQGAARHRVVRAV